MMPIGLILLLMYSSCSIRTISLSMPCLHINLGKQLLNVLLFSSFKNALNESTSIACSRGRIDVFNVFDFYGMLTYAYQAAFTKDNIVTAFRKSTIRPVDSKQFSSVPRPASREQINTILTVEDLERTLGLKKRRSQ